MFYLQTINDKLVNTKLKMIAYSIILMREEAKLQIVGGNGE